MKRGFLNTDKAQRKFAEISKDVPKDDPLDKGKGKAKAEIPVDAAEPCLPLLDFHSTEYFRSSADKNRFVFRSWPRDPNGKHILPSSIRGKEAGNGIDLWGSSLYDFYYVHRIPSFVNAMTISTGSKLTKVMQAFGELEHAKTEIAWASREPDPKEIPVWDPAQAIVAYERRVHMDSSIIKKETETESTATKVSREGPGADEQMVDAFETLPTRVVGSSMDTDEVPEGPASEDIANKPTGSRQLVDSKHEVGLEKPPSDVPVESPFHPSHYPSPWPLLPFESPYSPFTLQKRIPAHLFPKKLYVHDPWRLIHAYPRYINDGEVSWASKTDHIYTYTLSLPPESQKSAEAASKAAAAAEDEAVNVPQTILILPQENEGPTDQPAIRVFLPKRTRKLTEVPEAHLYLSPKGELGTGHHSIVYEAELELPRDLFCDSIYCKSCLDEQTKIEVDKLKESGEWEQRLNKVVEARESSGKHHATASMNSPSPSPVQIPSGYVGFVTMRSEHEPSQTVALVDGATLEETPVADAPSKHVARVSDTVIHRYFDYEGPVIPVHPNIQWQNPSYPETLCQHLAKKREPVPRTARFRVAAKLSLPEDSHLQREANNYLKFPEHFFQHWNGYNVIPPIKEPVPVGAVVPQFFGYYKPNPPPDSANSDAYYSPIMLIEHCGTPIKVSKLSIDDRHECASLLFRFHWAGWLHESFAERNILRQRQQPTCSPLEEDGECDFPHKHRPYSYRLIDFGRSFQYKDRGQRATEESRGLTLFDLL